VRKLPLRSSAALLFAAFGSGYVAQAADNLHCKLFTQIEASAYVGAPVGDGESEVLSNGCSWLDKSGGYKMSVSTSPAGNALKLPRWGFESWEGFRAVPNIGAKAYVVRRPIIDVMGTKTGGDWQAGAIVGDDYVVVSLKGPKASAGAAESLLKDALKRRQ